MSNAAHAESLDHEVYHRPLAVQPEFEYRTTPDNYRRTYLGSRKLPDQIRVWRVQKSRKGSVIVRGADFEDSPDAEILALGLNRAKDYGDVGIGRHGNVLEWGYGDPPSQMTGAGRRLFVNCIYYIRRFDGQPPLVRRQVEGRLCTLRWAPAPKGTTERKLVFVGSCAEDVMKKYEGRSDERNDYYVKNVELLYWDKGYRVDDDLKSLGIESNRKVETLERLFELRQDPARREIAQRLLDRYTDGQTTFDFQNGRDRIYFSDFGGYTFFVVPQGYLVGQKSGTGTSQSPSR
jgi:hypothetical protein